MSLLTDPSVGIRGRLEGRGRLCPDASTLPSKFVCPSDIATARHNFRQLLAGSRREPPAATATAGGM